MKRTELAKVMENHVRLLQNYSDRIPGAFAIEDIHDLRVGYKKLRALARLLKAERQTGNLQLGNALKNLYQAAGSVRDLQLFQQKLSAAETNFPLPEFSGCIARKLFRNKEKLVSRIEKIDWEKLRKSLRHGLPAILRDAGIRQFINEKVAALHILQMAGEQEEDLHSSRKHVKDIIYVVRVFQQDWSIPFPFPAWNDENQLHELATNLGNFNDQCITLSILQGSCSDRLPNEEASAVNDWVHALKQGIDKNKQFLFQQLQQLSLKAV